MPLHSTPKGDSPKETLAQLLKRIENSGAKVVQTIDGGDTWFVYATKPDTGHVEFRVTG